MIAEGMSGMIHIPPNTSVTIMTIVRMKFGQIMWGRLSFSPSCSSACAVSSLSLDASMREFAGDSAMTSSEDRSTMPRRLRSARPRITATITTQTVAMSMPGRSLRSSSPSSTLSAAMMRAVGPPQGRRFMIELAMITRTARSIIFMPSRR